MVQDFVNAIVEFVRAHEGWAMPVAFVVAFLESFCFLSLLWPGTAILVGVALLLAKSGVAATVVLPAVVAAGVGGSIGYAISYWIGQYYKDGIQNLYPFRRNPSMIEAGKAFFDKWGALSVFIGHFFGPVRAVIPVVAGMYQVPQWKFQLANVTSAFLWSAGVIIPPYYGLQYMLA